MKWQIKRWFALEIHYVDLFDRCRTTVKTFDTKADRQAVINEYLRQADQGIIKEVTSIGQQDIEIWERA